MRGMCRDPISELIWAYTDSSVVRYRPNEEGKYVVLSLWLLFHFIFSFSILLLNFSSFPVILHFLKSSAASSGPTALFILLLVFLSLIELWWFFFDDAKCLFVVFCHV